MVWVMCGGPALCVHTVTKIECVADKSCGGGGDVGIITQKVRNDPTKVKVDTVALEVTA